MYVRYRGGGVGHSTMRPVDVEIDEEWEDEELLEGELTGGSATTPEIDNTVHQGRDVDMDSDDSDDSDENSIEESESEGAGEDAEPDNLGPEDGQGDENEENVHGYAEL